MKKRVTLSIFAILMTGLLAFSGVGWAALAQDNNNPAARGPTPEEYGAITGRVTDVHGVGVADARIEIWDEATMARGWAWSTADGSFTNTGLVAGTYQIWVFPPEGVHLTPAFIPDIVVTAGVATAVDVVLLEEIRDDGIRLPQLPDLIFDPPLLPADYRDEVMMAPPVRDIPYKMETVVEGGGAISGRVTDAALGPVADVYVSVWDERGFRAGWDFTDQDGKYEITLPAGNYKIWFIPPEGVYLARTHISDIVVTAGETTTVDVILEVGGLISGRVTHAAGVGVTHARIVLRHPVIGIWNDWGIRTDADGNYTTIGLPAGTYEMRVFPPEGVYLAPAFISGIVVTAGETTTVDVTLKEGGLISGRVTDEAGVGVPNASVSVWGLGTGARGWARTDADGYYTTTGLAAGTYEMTVRPPRGVYLAPAFISGIVVTAGETTTVDVTLEEGGLISGRVTDPNGVGVARAWVSVRDPTTWAHGWARTDDQGNYTTTGLLPGVYEMTVRPPRGVYLAPASVPDIVVTVGQTTTVNVTLEEGGLISGRVTDGAGVGVPNAWVSVWDPATGAHGWAETDDHGYYTTTGLLPGVYEMEIFPPEGLDLAPAFIPDIVVTAGQTTEVNVTLEEAGVIAGTVRDTGGKPAGGISIHVSDEATGDRMGHAWTTEDGSYAITVPPGTYRIFLQSPPGGPYLAPTWVRGIEVTAGVTTTVDVTLAAGGRVSGTVTDPDGVGVAGAGIRVNGFGTTTDADGSFTTIGLLPGIYEMKVTPPEGVNLAPARIPGIVITAGETIVVNVALKLPGDATGDGKVDASDLTLVTRAF
ncbi:carboxypeptidase-like regulatory domain-containing protein, partial [Dehalococcoidia bacterium]|nr:carboxypeptidase-like regulatory domain-containing protein [Dehalococcoidia bacterium]